MLANFRDAAAERNAVRASFLRGETLDEKSFDGGRDGVFEAFGFRVRLRPGNADDVGEQHFCELMAEHEMFGGFAAFGGEMNLATALHGDMSIASHALECGGDGGRSDVELFG